MRTPLRLTALLAAATFAVAAAPTPEAPGYSHPDETREIFFDQQDRWMTASSMTGVGNIDHEQDGWMSWDDSAPDAAFGGTTVGTSYPGFRAILEEKDGERGQLSVEGETTGYLDSIVMDLFWLDPTEAGFGCGMDLAIDLWVDGIPVIDVNSTSDRVPVTTDVAGAGFVSRVKVTNIFDKLESYGPQYVGTEDQVHTVRVVVYQFPICQEAIWVYDSADAPTSLRFNLDPSDPSVANHTLFGALNPFIAPPAS